MQASKQLTVVICQIHPIIKKKKENIARFSQRLQPLKLQDGIDLVLFPEMSFTGYNFKNAEDVLQMAVPFGEGEEFEFARVLSLKLKAYVLFGYVEKVMKEGKTVLYNSAAMSDREGNFVFNTRKTHLYFADELWGQEGEGFKAVQIKNLKGDAFKCAVGICMDINPKHFTSGKHQFGSFVVSNNCELILFPTNWIDNDKDDPQTSFQIYNYWLQRLTPVLKAEPKRKMYFLAADRVGKQYSYYDKQDICFIGSSCIISIHPHQLKRFLNKTQENWIKETISIPKH